MKLLVTTAAAAIAFAAVANAQDDAVSAEAGAAGDVNAAAESKIVEDGELSTGAGMDVGAGAEARGLSREQYPGRGMGQRSMTELDTNADGVISLAEAQAYDPSITATSFAGFDRDGDGGLDTGEYSSWAAQMDRNIGQGDVDLDVDTDLNPGLDTDFDAGADLDTSTDLDTGIDADAGVDAGVGLDLD